MDIKDIVAYIASFIIIALQYTCKNAINLIIFCHRAYPEVTNGILFIIIMYIIYRLTVRTVRMWINFAIFVFKVVFVLCLLITLLVLYVRGLEKFMNQDIPFLQLLISAFSQQGGTTKMPWWWLLTNLNLSDFGFDVKGAAENIRFEDSADEYFEYAKQHYEKTSSDDIQRLIEEGIGYIQDNVDLQQLGNNILNAINNL